jgi:hypothetical protein
MGAATVPTTMVRKGSPVRVRQRALGNSLLMAGGADSPDSAGIAVVVLKVPRRYNAGRGGVAGLGHRALRAGQPQIWQGPRNIET